MAQALRVQKGHVAGIGTLPKRVSSFKETAFRVAALVAGFLPVPIVGSLAYFGLESLANSTKAQNEKTALAKWYAPQVAAQLGIDPAKVTASDLQLAASVNPAIARVVDKVHQEQQSAAVTTAMASAAGAIVGGSAIAGGVAKMVASAAASTASGAVGSWLTSPDVLKNPQVIVEHIAKERAAGKQITPVETFMLRVAQRSDLQQAVKQATGKEYYALTPQQHMALMHQFPRIAAFAEKDAVLVNRGGAVQDLMFVLPEAHWQTRLKQETARLQNEVARS